MKSANLVFRAPHIIEVQTESLGELPRSAVLVRTILSAVSAGTELLFYRGQIPDGMMADMSVPALQRSSSYPVRYGYASVGEVEAQGEEVEGAWTGKKVFAFQPHADRFIASPDELVPLPEALLPDDAVFLPFMETAVNFVLDGAPLLGEAVAVFGQGVIGLLTTSLLARCSPRRLVAFDRFPLRREAALSLGADRCLDPDAAGTADSIREEFYRGEYDGADLIYELTGDPSVMNRVLELSGFNGRIVVGSWYGTKTAAIALGGSFHRKRCAIVSSQVSTIAPANAGRWSKARRRSTAETMMEKLSPRRLITHRFPFSRAAEAYELLDRSPEAALQVVLEY